MMSSIAKSTGQAAGETRVLRYANWVVAAYSRTEFAGGSTAILVISSTPPTQLFVSPRYVFVLVPDILRAQLYLGQRVTVEGRIKFVGSDEQNARGKLHDHLATLRKKIGPSSIPDDGQTLAYLEMETISPSQ